MMMSTAATSQSESIILSQQQVRDLLQQQLYDSAEILCGLVMCRSRAVSPDLPCSGPGSHAESLELYGDTLYGTNEYRRALNFYRQAGIHRKLGLASRSRGRSFAAATTPSSAGPLDSASDAELKLKECNCHIKLNEPSQALRALIAISPRHRTLAIYLALGKVYRTLGLKRDATNMYKAALKINPLALEASIALAELGVSQGDIWGIAASAPAAEGGGAISTPLGDISWLETFIAAHTAAQGQKFTIGMERFTELERLFNSSSHCLLHKARLQIEQDQLVDAQATFGKALEADAELMDLMDYYAVLLRQKAAAASLNDLAHKLMSVDQRRPEPWVAVSLHCDLRGDKDKALTFVDRALQVAPSHVLAYHVKGTLLLSLGRSEAAASVFLHANSLQKDIYSFKGLVDSYLALRKFKEALSIAKEALAEMPKNAKAITLVGRVLTQLPDGRDKAKRAFQRALSIDPLTVDATLALSDLYIQSREFDRCIELLRTSLEQSSHDFLHTKLGEVYTMTEDYSNALSCFHTAISINSASAAAAAGLERLEKLMRGVDPDAEDDEAELEQMEGDGNGGS